MTKAFNIVVLVFILTIPPTSSANATGWYAEWNENGGIWVVGDEEFRAKVNWALLRIGYAQWIPYVRKNIAEIHQWNGNEHGHVGVVLIEQKNCNENDVCRGTFLVHRDVGTVEWLAMAIIHEAAHVAIRNAARREIRWEDECIADYITQAFAITAGLYWNVRPCQ